MSTFIGVAAMTAMLVPVVAFASGEIFFDPAVRAAPECSPTTEGVTPPTLSLSVVRIGGNAGEKVFASSPRDEASRFADVEAHAVPINDMRGLAAELDVAVRRGDLKAAVQLGVMMEQGDGVPADPRKASELYCRAARYGDAEGLFNLGWTYAHGRGVRKDERVAAALFRRASDRGHGHAGSLLNVAHEKSAVALPACLTPASLPLAALPRAPEATDVAHDAQLPAVPKDIAQLVQKLAPQYAIDSNLALAVIWAESSFNPNALSGANAQGLMQLIPETAERFGVKKPLTMDDNIKGGLAYLRWLFAYFRGDVSLVLAAYNAGEGTVEKYRGIPPYAETRDYVKKIMSVYRRLAHPYNPGVVGASPLIAQLVSAAQTILPGYPGSLMTR